MEKLRFTQLPIYKAIRGSKLSKRAQDEVLRKLKKYRNQGHPAHNFETAYDIHSAINWGSTEEGYGYWSKMQRDSGL
jgi:hypothetical protein